MLNILDLRRKDLVLDDEGLVSDELYSVMISLSVMTTRYLEIMQDDRLPADVIKSILVGFNRSAWERIFDEVNLNEMLED